MGHSRAVHLLCAVLFGLLMGWAAPSTTWAGGNANFFLGQKSLDKHDWDPVQDQAEFGAEVTFGKKGWPVQIAIDALGSSDEHDLAGVTFKGSTSELDAGVRKVWVAGKSHPYIGGGLAFIYTKFEGTISGITVSDDDTARGYWLGAGIFWRLGRAFNIGASARYSNADVTMFGIGGQGGGSHFGLLLGWGWPAGK